MALNCTLMLRWRDSRPKGRGFEPHRRHCVVSLSKNINPSLVLVQPRKIRPFITERLLMGRKELNQTNKNKASLANLWQNCQQVARNYLFYFCCLWQCFRKGRENITHSGEVLRTFFKFCGEGFLRSNLAATLE